MTKPDSPPSAPPIMGNSAMRNSAPMNLSMSFINWLFGCLDVHPNDTTGMNPTVSHHHPRSLHNT